ncbi:AMP-binding enzyme family protein [Burkholderia pseudomallei]|nr:AMP-binding enzyme family protein [Burkholderia pseudomallei MSHR2543]KGC95397.1 AMP-binding enzyme family protein [Burkholderia pseudomallei]
MIEHRNAVSFIDWARRAFPPESFDGVLASTSVCFDLSVFEIFATLAAAGRIVLVRDVLALPELPDGLVRLVNSVPSAIHALLQTGRLPASVRTVNLAGEPLRQSLVDALYDAGVERVYDLYGPSEDTTYSTCALRTPRGREVVKQLWTLLRDRLRALRNALAAVPSQPSEGDDGCKNRLDNQ